MLMQFQRFDEGQFSRVILLLIEVTSRLENQTRVSWEHNDLIETNSSKIRLQIS